MRKGLEGKRNAVRVTGPKTEVVVVAKYYYVVLRGKTEKDQRFIAVAVCDSLAQLQASPRVSVGYYNVEVLIMLRKARALLPPLPAKNGALPCRKLRYQFWFSNVKCGSCTAVMVTTDHPLMVV